MKKHKVLSPMERKYLLNALYIKYEKKQGWAQHLTYLRKKYSWLIIVNLTTFIKRFLDLFLGIILVIVFSPVMVFIGLLIKFNGGGSIFYVSDRVGKWGKEFKFIKFRTMIKDAEQMKQNLLKQNEFKSDISFKMKKDPRITTVGRFLRKTSLDELPQLWNVLKGDMSLVGPRPPIPSEVAKYTLEERYRLDVKPGLTCIWQVSGRSNVPFEKQVQLDLQYIESQSFWLDIRLLLKTIPAVLFGRGAY
jgi:lipopolysaccharide/colanic/teichoic acid biosynthesis glycosyltransferase